jgi:hypothetical protein
MRSNGAAAAAEAEWAVAGGGSAAVWMHRHSDSVRLVASRVALAYAQPHASARMRGVAQWTNRSEMKRKEKKWAGQSVEKKKGRKEGKATETGSGARAAACLPIRIRSFSQRECSRAASNGLRWMRMRMACEQAETVHAEDDSD